MCRDLDTARAAGSQEQRGSLGGRERRQGEAEFVTAFVPEGHEIRLIGSVDIDKPRGEASSHGGPAGSTDHEVGNRAVEPGPGPVWMPSGAGFGEQLHEGFLGDIFGKLGIPCRSQGDGVGHRRMDPMSIRDVVVGRRY